jgi:hypothetical protein
MRVRIQFGVTTRAPGRNRRIALGLAALLPPAFITAFVIGIWRIAYELDWTDQFGFPTGPLSRWQVWIGGALGLLACSWVLNRYGNGYKG